MKSIHELPLECRVSGLAENGPDSPDGIYRIPHNWINKYIYSVIFSSGMGWEHMSVTLLKVDKKKVKAVDRCPTWEEMCFLKNIFWDLDECCVQYHPPMADYVSNHPHCLHIWRSTDKEMPSPPAVMVGLTNNDATIAWLKERYPELTEKEYMEIIYYADASTLKIGDETSEKEFKERIYLYFKSISGVIQKDEVN
jgi:hypothetical protein